ncbi:MAG TPA: ABC transporter permease [Desulfobacterales bacterium]|nr:ABC transporter permease [Desulfobacterales bacterium]
MKIFMMIGWRNLWRNKRRSVVVIFSIALGIFAMLLSMGIMNGINNQMVENTISTSLGHISIHRKGFQDDMKLQNSFSPSGAMESELLKIPSVRGFSFRVKLEGMIRSSEASSGVLIMGIEPAREPSVSKILEYMLVDGESKFLSSPEAHDILLSKTLADKLDLLVGDKAVLMFQDINQDIVGTALTVKGLYQSPVDSFDRYVVYIGIRAMQELAGLADRISEISVRTAHRNQVDETADLLRNSISRPSFEILTWKEMAPNLFRAVTIFDTMMYIFFAIIFTTVVFSIANTLIMSIMERFHEIGVMKSIGTRPSRIFAMVLFEAVNLGLVGLIAGIFSGALAVFFLSIVGIDLSFYMDSVRTWGTGHVIYPTLKPMDILASTLIVLVTTVFASLYPAVKAARIKPLEALHYL